ncbi:hypothetical protein ACWF9G_23660 [Nocardia sp. NPDC055029]
MNIKLRAAATAFAVAPFIALGSGVATADAVPGPSVEQLHDVGGGGGCVPPAFVIDVGGWIIFGLCLA